MTCFHGNYPVVINKEFPVRKCVTDFPVVHFYKHRDRNMVRSADFYRYRVDSLRSLVPVNP